MSPEEGSGSGPGRGAGALDEILRSLRRWVTGLGTAMLLLLLARGATRAVLLGYSVGWLLSLYSLDHIAAGARRVAERPLTPAEAKKTAARTFMGRWVVVVGAILVASRLGADPVAAVAALLLLQAAVMCRSIASLFGGGGAEAGDEPDSRDETVDE